jgi:uncharacterized RDD family membrane protein YckC
MKCPKCHYLSFEPEPRCRNCGYDLALAGSPDLELRTDDPYEGPLMDLAMRPDGEGTESRGKAATLGPIDLDRVVGESEPAREPALPGPGAARGDEPTPLRAVPGRERPPQPTTHRRRPAPSTTAELPLFVKKRPEPDPDAPLVKLPAAPTPPLVVRRAQEAPKPKHAAAPAASDASLGPLERDLLNDIKRLEQRIVERARVEIEEEEAEAADQPAVGIRRLVAAAIDATVLGTISAAVLWATLRLCDLGLGELATLPIVPLSAFLLLVAIGYLLTFTVAGGQTIGKMAMDIRVVGDEAPGDGAVTPQQAAVRAVLTVPSVLFLGLGFLPAFAGHGVAIHDRLSHTRVVEA